MIYNFDLNEESSLDLDKNDPLSHFRDKFFIPKKNDSEAKIYFTGNSLGLQPKSLRTYIEQELKDWEDLGVDGHIEAKNPWMPYHEFVTESLAELCGANPNEVVAMNSLTTNLHLLMVSFYRPNTKRKKIMIEADAFPSDIYAVKSQLKFHGNDIENDLILLKPRNGETCLRTEDIIDSIDKYSEELALIMIGGVNYYTGQFFEIEKITKHAKSKDIMVGWDLAHAMGNLPLKLHDWQVDFASWCSYKYLNSGPGAISGIFVHNKYSQQELPRFEGWWGHNKETRFQMGPDFEPIKGAEAWQLSNPPILSLASLKCSLDIFREAGINNLRTKSLKLTAYLEFLINNINSQDIEIITPKDKEQRGCQLSIKVKNANKTIFNKLSNKGVVADWREPDVIRVAPVPLYNSFNDCFRFYKLLKELTEK